MAVAAPFPTAHARSVDVLGSSRTFGAHARQAHHPAPRSTVRLTRRGRIVAGIVLSVPFVAILMMVGSWSADAETQASAAPATGVVVVQAGQSLWEIASAVAPESDPRATITAIRDLNGLGSDAVVPGQALVVPSRG